MIRLLGVLVGSALAVAALVMFVGVPQVPTEPRYAPIGENGIIRLPEPVVADVGQPAAEEIVAADVDGAAEAAVERIPEPVDAEAPAESTIEPAARAIEPAAPDAQPQQWYAFWSPFRSEIAANGFIAQLQRVTGLDYRVVKVRTGVYEVAFAYSDDDEILSNLSRISAATGLVLPDG